jgi:polynucleotide 5'-hydroxyl-kinase GRC3/NOL9
MCKINIKGGESWLAPSSTAGTSIWKEIIQKIFCEKVFSRTILIVGNTDTGKSSLAVYITNEALKNGFTACYMIDADIGQGDIAPPTAIGGAVITKKITDLRDVNAQFFEFVGSTSPVGFERIVINAIKNILKQFGTFCGICIINTDGYILNKGIDYKVRMAQELRPDLIICLGDLSVFNIFRAKFISSSTVLYGKSPSNTIKSRIDRSQRRLDQFLRYVTEEKDSKSNIVSKDLQQIKFVYKGKMYFKIRTIRYGFIHFENNRNGIQIKRRKLANIFVALGSDHKNILGFGIILNISRHRVYVKSSVHNFNKIYLSNSGISSEGNRVDFRII